MPPRIIQWLPTEAFDQVFLVPRDGKGEAFARRANELGLRVQSQRAQIYASGTNIDGGWIDVGDELAYVQLLDGPIEELARTTAELIDVIEPTRFLVRDYDGTRAVHVDDDIAIIDVADWRQHLASESEADLLVAAATESIVARGNRARVDDLAELEELVAVATSEFEPLTLLARLYLDLDRLDDAEKSARALLALDVRDYRKAPAQLVLGEVATKRGEAARALEHHEAAVKMHRQVPAILAAGVAAIRAGDAAKAAATLTPFHRGRTLFEIAEAMCAMDRIDDAHAYLEVALEIERDLLKPVPDNQWPKPPDTAWTAPHAELATLVEIARSRHG